MEGYGEEERKGKERRGKGEKSTWRGGEGRMIGQMAEVEIKKEMEKTGGAETEMKEKERRERKEMKKVAEKGEKSRENEKGVKRKGG